MAKVQIKSEKLYVLNLGHTPVLGHLASAQQDVR